MIIPRLALRNLFGAGLRTWLNVAVLSFAFVAIIWTQGLIEGMNRQIMHDKIDAEYGRGQYWNEHYNPYDPLSLQDAHSKLPKVLQNMANKGQAAPVLILQGTIYPDGRITPVLLKGIDPSQSLLSLPSQFLDQNIEEIPALIGSRMAKNSGLNIGDVFTIQWRDSYGTFDALDARIMQIMNTPVASIDSGQIWIPLKRLQMMAQMEEEATLVVIDKTVMEKIHIPGWTFKTTDFLLSDIKSLVQTKTIGSSIVYVILLFLAMLAIFDTQVLSIFRRRKEMGTLMALGLPRFKVIQLFTLEGAMHGVLAAIIGAIYGIPLLIYFSSKGWAMPESIDSFGFALGKKLFPTYSAGLVIGTTILVLLVTTIVSYLPTRKITKLKPTDALRGKFS